MTSFVTAYVEGYLTLELCFEQDLHEFRPGVDFSLIESSGAYFEAYRHNLAGKFHNRSSAYFQPRGDPARFVPSCLFFDQSHLQ